MASFSEFLSWPVREEIVLAELTPSLTLTGWTLQTGSTYKVTLSRFDTDTPGLSVYRRCVGVRQNATDLTERSSIATVDANPGSWWWDEPNSLLYVRTTTGSDPDVFTTLQAFVTLYCATTGIVLNRVDGNPDTGIYYQPWLTDELPGAVFFADDQVAGTKTAVNVTLALTNGHGFFHRAYHAYNWRNKRVRLFLGGSYNGQTLLRSQYAATLTMLVESLAPSETACTCHLRPILRLLDQDVPVTPYLGDLPYLGEGVSGTKKWIGYGRATMPPDLTDTSGLGVYTVADAAFQTLTAIHAVYAVPKGEGTPQGLTLGVHYTQDLTACTITIIDATYAWTEYTLTADVTGLALSTFAAIAQDLLTRFLGIPTAEIDTASFTAAAAEAPQELAVWLKQPRSLASILATGEPESPALERSVLGRVLQTPAGTWTCQIFRPGGAPAATLRKEDFTAFAAVPVLDTIAPTVEVRFDQNFVDGSFRSHSETNAAVQYEAETSARVPVVTFLRRPGDAEVLAKRLARVLGETPISIDFTERGALLAEAGPGDKVSVTYDPGPDPAGAFAGTLFELVMLERSLRPVLTVSGRLLRNPLESAAVGTWATGAGAGHWGGGSPTQWY